MTKPKVLVIGADENPSLPVIESLTKKGIDVTVGSHKRVCVGFFSKHPKRRVLYPSPADGPERFIDAIRDLLRKDPHEVTLVCGEENTYLLSKHKDLLTPYTSIPLVGIDTLWKCRDKSKTMKAAAEIGVPHPTTYFPEEEAIESIRDRVQYPVVVKPCVSYGARGIVRVNRRGDLSGAHQLARAQYGACIIQEFIPHDGMQYKAEFLLDRNSQVKAWGVYSKPRYYPPEGGSSTLNCTVDRRDILELGARILEHMGWYGMGDCDFIEDPRDGVPKLMEINPRFTRSIKVLTAAGVDFPYLLYKLAMGEDLPIVKEYKVGQYLRYFFGDVMWFVKSSERLKAKPSFFQFWHRDLQYEVISLGDPGPAVAYTLSMLQELLDPKRRAFRLR